ncbi:MAG: hypothetical protein FWE35_29115 [Streptosporangiales bacterium]|nr:hypothetical protein [Streptosporangiales bacterium]
MRITSDTVADGIREQLFTVGDIPGVLWTPAEGAGPRPLVLIGHGGGQHKKGWEVVSRAFPYVTSCGFAVAAIDAPGTGDRPEHPEIKRLVAEMTERAWASTRNRVLNGSGRLFEKVRHRRNGHRHVVLDRTAFRFLRLR